MPVRKSPVLKELERQMSQATTYEEWSGLAAQHDAESGAELWRQDDRSTLYDFYSINTRLQNLQNLARTKDDHGLLFALNEGIHGNMAGMGRAKLYQHAKTGTKYLIESYVAEICEALNYLSPTDFPGIPWGERHEFYKRASHCYGRSALMLSGGGILGYFHYGVIKALIEQKLCPVVISGASAGASVAAVIGTHSDEAFLKLFENGFLPRRLVELQNKVLNQESKTLDRHTVQIFKESMAMLVPDMTFKQAYEATGRCINISISPAEPRQNSRLLNHIASPNVTLYSAVLASSALPGMLPPIRLEARDVHGNVVPYLPSRRWIDGTFSQDLPARRLARMYGVNHFIVSQVMPGMGKESGTSSRIDRILWVAYMAAMKQLMRSFLDAAQHYAQVGPRIGVALNTINSLLDQRYTGDINIFPGYGLSAAGKMTKAMSEDKLIELIKAGERATWPKLPMIETTTRIGRTLDRILLDFEIDEAHWLSTAPQTDVALGDLMSGAAARRKADNPSRGRKATLLRAVKPKNA